MDTPTALSRILEIGIIPSVRTASAADARFASETICDAGIPIVEITMTIPGAIAVIAELARALPDMTIGAGTVLDIDTARRSVDAGATFVTGPGFDSRIAHFGVKQHVLVMPGAMTPTEVAAARHSGAELIKVFPCGPLGGAEYVRALRGPFPDTRFVAAGGVNLQNAGDILLAGAVAIGVGREMVPRQAIEQRQADWIEELARRFMGIVREARASLADA